MSDKKQKDLTSMEIWHLLNEKDSRAIYDKAKSLKLLRVGHNLKYYQVRGGLVLADIAQKIARDPQLLEHFKIKRKEE